MVRTSTKPRIAPGGRDDIGRFTWTLLKIGSRRVGGPVPHVMTTLARSRRLFLPWLWFASRLMPNGTLPAREAELVILRVATLCGSDYERHHHSHLGRQAGLSEAVVAWTDEADASTIDPPADGTVEPLRATLLVRACDELVETHTLTDATWDGLGAFYRDDQLIELCMLVGQYTMLAGTLNAVGVEIEDRPALHKLR
ncbi:MAG: carboxymuconolactone decarboxylase family protein [Solirubrobacteraceae bacterium]|nr:carboxymuconolactone decarboxylase family protein [Patulibacter sp.]